VERAHRLQQQTAYAYTAYRNSIPQGVDPDELRDAAGQCAFTDQALALPGALQAVKEDSDAAASKVNDLIKGMRVGDDVASQLAAQRFWARTQRSLDAIKDQAKVVAAVQNLIANAEDKDVPVIAEELSDYLASRNIPAGWLPALLANKVPGLSDAAADAITKARQYAIVQANHDRLTKAMERDLNAPELLSPMEVNSEPYSDTTSG
jgi:hypothetical protein